MKKIFTLLFAAVLFSASTFSQVFVGGSFSLSNQGSSTSNANTTVDGPSITIFTVNPMVGYYLNSQMAVGIEFGMGFSSHNNNATPTATKTTSSIFSFSPFLRYHLVEMGPISVFGQGSVGIGFVSSKIKTGNVSSDGPKTTMFEIALRPGVSYKLTDKIAIEAFLGGLTYNSAVEKRDVAGSEVKDKDHSLSLNFSTALNLGFVYKF
jgi:outer membrane protein